MEEALQNDSRILDKAINQVRGTASDALDGRAIACGDVPGSICHRRS